MKTVQMTFDEDLLKEVDQVTRELGITRSAFTREALREAIERHKIRKMEEQHRKGYIRYPVREGEFSDWEDEQEWGLE